MHPHLAGRHVLVVEDEPISRRVMIESIRVLHPALQVHAAVNGEEALDLLRALPIDLVVTDVQMPRLDGFGLLQAMLNEGMAVPTLVTSAFGGRDVEHRLQQLGALHFLGKPVEPKVLRGWVEDLLPAQAAHVGGVTLPGFVNLLALEGRSGRLVVKSGYRAGSMFFRDGQLFHAEVGGKSGDEAALLMLGWSGVRVDLQAPSIQPERNVHSSLVALIAETRRRSDGRASPSARGETWSAREPVTTPSARGETWSAREPVTTPSSRGEAWSAREPTTTPSLRGETWSARESATSPSVGSTRGPSSSPGSSRRLQLDLRWLLDAGMQVAGVQGVALFDRESGLCLRSRGGGRLAIDVVGASICQVAQVQQKNLGVLGVHEPIESVIISLSGQHHVVRPLRQHPTVMLYAVIDSTKTDLTLALSALSELSERTSDESSGETLV